jgi:hypothetical protein
MDPGLDHCPIGANRTLKLSIVLVTILTQKQKISTMGRYPNPLFCLTKPFKNKEIQKFCQHLHKKKNYQKVGY